MTGQDDWLYFIFHSFPLLLPFLYFLLAFVLFHSFFCRIAYPILVSLVSLVFCTNGIGIERTCINVTNELLGALGWI